MSGPTNTQFAVAVHSLTLLASAPDTLQSSEQMAANIGANPVYVRRVLGRLRGAGVVDSRPGPHGGWRLRQAASDISLGSIWRAVQADGQVLGLHSASPDCAVGRRVHRTLADLDCRASAAIVRQLDGTTVADVLAAADDPVAATA